MGVYELFAILGTVFVVHAVVMLGVWTLGAALRDDWVTDRDSPATRR